MCWSVESSLLSALIFGIGIAVVWFLNPTRKIVFYIFFAFYGSMQLFQALTWMYGDVQDTMSTFSGSCSVQNKIFTYVANGYIWIQPALFASFAWISYRNTPYFKLFILYMIVFLFSVSYTIYNTETNAARITWNWTLRDSNFGPVTCTLLGDTGYMLWIFASGRPDLQPTWAVYVILIFVTTKVFYHTTDLHVISFSWWFTYLITRSILPLSFGESTALWCTLSVIAVPIVLLYSFYEYHHRRQIHDVSLVNSRF